MDARSAFILIACLLACGISAYCAARALLELLDDRSGGLVELAKDSIKRATATVCALGPIARVLEVVRRNRRARALEEAMPEALRLLSVALDSGSSLVHALEYTTQNCAEPLASELERTVWDLQAGQGFDEAMEGLRARTGGTAFSYLAVAMEIQHRAGSSMGPVLASVSASLRHSRELADELRTKTAQGRLSARIVIALPVLVMVLVSLFSPAYFLAFFSSALGVFLLVVACLLEVLGVISLRRALALDLSVAQGGG